MSKNQTEVILKFKNNSNIIQNDKLNDETLKSIINDINILYEKINDIQSEIAECDNEESLNKIDISTISNDIGLTIQNAIIIDETDLKKTVEELNLAYRNLEISYFNKKIEILSNTINKTAVETEQNLKDITGGTLFSIASVFLGISLTSALVTGVQEINENFIILYFMTCLLIPTITIGIATLLMRKFDKKSIAISIIIILVSILWGVTAYFTYDTNNNNNECQKENLVTDQESNEGSQENNNPEQQKVENINKE